MKIHPSTFRGSKFLFRVGLPMLAMMLLVMGANYPVITRLGDLSDVRVPAAAVRTNATAVVWDTNTMKFILGSAVSSSGSGSSGTNGVNGTSGTNGVNGATGAIGPAGPAISISRSNVLVGSSITNLNLTASGSASITVASNNLIVTINVDSTGGSGITNSQQLFGVMGNHGVITNESQALLTGNLMQGSNQVWSLTTTAATINMACSNLNEDTQYFLVTTNSVLTVFGTMTNVDYVQGWRAIPANSVTVITFYKKVGKTTAFINSGIATYPLSYADATNIVVDGSFAPNFSLNITNATVNLLITNFALAASIDITGWSNGFSTITTVNNAFRVLTNSTGLSLTTNGNALDVLTLKRSTNSTTAAAQVAKGFQ